MGFEKSKVKSQMSKIRYFLSAGWRIEKYLLIVVLLVTCHLSLVTSVYAQLEIAETYDMPEGAADGDIVSYVETGIALSSREYDDKIFGVVETTPLVAYRRVDNTGEPVLRSGTAEVSVTTINGPIKTGDFITSSSLPGKGEKAVTSGYIIGVALADFGEQDGEAVDYTPPGEGQQQRQVQLGKINVAIKIEYAELNTARNANRLFDVINGALFRSVQDPERFVNLFRYIAAGLAVLISFLIGFFTLARTIPKGIEALGRNPLAKTTIQFGIILNIIFTVGIALVGIVAAIILLRF
jgi:F0F1-type ATP synthase membrane subunit c/vacuolar-type H+-ATPase subunit K